MSKKENEKQIIQKAKQNEELQKTLLNRNKKKFLKMINSNNYQITCEVLAKGANANNLDIIFEVMQLKKLNLSVLLLNTAKFPTSQNFSLFTKLLDNGINQANVNFADHEENTALTYCAINGDVERIKVLLQKGSDIDHKNVHLRTPVIESAYNSKSEAVRFLLSQNANILAIDNAKNSLINISAENCDFETNKMIIDSMPKLSFCIIPDPDKETVKTEMSQTQSHIKAYLNYKNSSGCNSAIFAAKNPDLKVLELFINQGADINSSGTYFDSPFLQTAEKSDLNKLKYLLNLVDKDGKRVIDINQRGYNGRTALKISANNNDSEMFKYLISKGARIDILSYAGCTLEMVNKMTEGIMNGGCSPIIILMKNNNFETLAFLKKYLEQEYLKNHQGSNEGLKDYVDSIMRIDYTALAQAVNQHNIPMIQYCLNNGFDVNEPDEFGRTPLFHASSDSLEIVKMLCEHTDVNKKMLVDVNKKCQGISVLKIAKYTGHDEIVKYLISKGAIKESEMQNPIVNMNTKKSNETADIISALHKKALKRRDREHKFNLRQTIIEFNCCKATPVREL